MIEGRTATGPTHPVRAPVPAADGRDPVVVARHHEPLPVGAAEHLGAPPRPVLRGPRLELVALVGTGDAGTRGFGRQAVKVDDHVDVRLTAVVAATLEQAQHLELIDLHPREEVVGGVAAHRDGWELREIVLRRGQEGVAEPVAPGGGVHHEQPQVAGSVADAGRHDAGVGVAADRHGKARREQRRSEVLFGRGSRRERRARATRSGSCSDPRSGNVALNESDAAVARSREVDLAEA